MDGLYYLVSRLDFIDGFDQNGQVFWVNNVPYKSILFDSTLKYSTIDFNLIEDKYQKDSIIYKNL